MLLTLEIHKIYFKIIEQQEHIRIFKTAVVYSTCKSFAFQWCEIFLSFCLNFMANFTDSTVHSYNTLHYVLVTTVQFKIWTQCFTTHFSFFISNFLQTSRSSISRLLLTTGPLSSASCKISSSHFCKNCHNTHFSLGHFQGLKYSSYTLTKILSRRYDIKTNKCILSVLLLLLLNFLTSSAR